MQSTTQHIKNLYKLGSHTMIVVSVTTVVRCATMYTRTSTPLNIIVIKVATYIYKRERESTFLNSRLDSMHTCTQMSKYKLKINGTFSNLDKYIK